MVDQQIPWCRLRHVGSHQQIQVQLRFADGTSNSPAPFYSFSFSLNYKWTSLYPEGAEIHKYLEDITEKYQFVDKIQVNTDVSELRWLEDEQLWEATLTHMVPGTGDLSRKAMNKRIAEQGRESVYLRQEIVRARIVCSCAGGLVEPNAWPSSIPGRDSFEGPVFHSARWDHSVDFNDKNVVVIGTGCSAAQFVPRLIKEPYNAKSVTQIMRSPPWVVPKAVPLVAKKITRNIAPRSSATYPAWPNYSGSYALLPESRIGSQSSMITVGITKPEEA